MEASFKEGQLLRKGLEGIKDLLNEIVFHCTPDGISAKSLDNAHVAWACLAFKTGAFHRYRLTRNYALGINIGTLERVLKCGGKEDNLRIKTIMDKDDKPERLCISLESEGNKTGVYEMKLMNLDAEYFEYQRENVTAEVTMESSEFAKIIRNLIQFGEDVKIKVKENQISFQTSPVELGRGRVTLKGSAEGVEITAKENVELSFSLKYLNHFSKGSGISDRVRLEFLENTVLHLVYEKEGGVVSLSYCLGSKIEND